MRRIYLETSVLSSHAGSSLVELGHTKVLGKLSITTDGNRSQVDTGVLQIRVEQLPHLGMPLESNVSTLDGRPQNTSKVNTTQQLHLESRLQAALTPALRLEDYPKMVLQIELTVLQHDGSLLPVCMAAATLALADARVEVYDLVTCCQVAIMPKDDDGDQILLADPTFSEEQAAMATVTLAIMPNWKEVTMWQQSGPTPQDAIDICLDGCRTIHRILRQKLLETSSSEK